MRSAPIGALVGNWTYGTYGTQWWCALSDETTPTFQLTRSNTRDPEGYIQYNGQNIIAWYNRGYIKDQFYLIVRALVPLETNIGNFAANQDIYNFQAWQPEQKLNLIVYNAG